MGNRLHVSQGTRTDLKFRGGFPVASLHRVARRRNGQRVRPRQICSAQTGNCHHLVDGGLGFLVLSKLQIGVHLIVHRVQLVVQIPGLFRDTRCFHVGGDRFSPITNPRENV